MTNTDTEEMVYEQLGSKTQDGKLKVLRSFYLDICKGPGVAIPAGAIVRLKKETAFEVFGSGQAVPLELSDPGEYTVVRRFRFVNGAGLYEMMVPGMVIELRLSDALEHLRRENIKPAYYVPMFGEVR